MMVGEIDFRESFLPFVESGVYNPSGSYFIGPFLILFVIMINIVMYNLLIALTVNKTEELAKIANITRLEKIVDQIDNAEDLFKHTLGMNHKISRHNQIFFQLQKALGESDALGWKVCVIPFSREEQRKKNAMGRKIVSFHTGNDTTSVTSVSDYSIYAYDDMLCKYTCKLPFKMPSGVVRETLAYLRDKKYQENKKNQKILEREMNSYIDTDKVIDHRKNSIVSMKRVMDNLSASKLPSIHEENSRTLEKVEKKMDEMEGNFSKMMNRKIDQSNQELVKLVGTMIHLNFEEKLKEFKTEFSTKEEKMDQSHQALLNLGDKMDTILATLQEATSTTNF